MASTGINNGTLTKVNVGGTVIDNLVSNTITMGRETYDITTKGSSGWRDLAYGKGFGTISGNGFFAEDATYNFKDLFAILSAKTESTIQYGSDVAGDEEYSFTGIMTNLSRTAPVEDVETFDVTFESDGAITEAVAV